MLAYFHVNNLDYVLYSYNFIGIVFSMHLIPIAILDKCFMIYVFLPVCSFLIMPKCIFLKTIW